MLFFTMISTKKHSENQTKRNFDTKSFFFMITACYKISMQIQLDFFFFV